MMKKLRQILTCCMVAALSAGCASSSPMHFYTLSPTSVPTVVSEAKYSVSVGPVSVPSVVDRLQIVLRAGPNQVSISEFDRWASPLRDDIGRVVAENLVSMLGTKQVTLFPQSAVIGVSYRVIINFLRFDSELGKAATLDVLWTVSSAHDGQSYRGRTTLTEAVQGAEYAALIAAHSSAIGRLCNEIAETIQDIENRKL
jgi:hypothetical protein